MRKTKRRKLEFHLSSWLIEGQKLWKPRKRLQMLVDLSERSKRNLNILLLPRRLNQEQKRCKNYFKVTWMRKNTRECKKEEVPRRNPHSKASQGIHPILISLVIFLSFNWWMLVVSLEWDNSICWCSSLLLSQTLSTFNETHDKNEMHFSSNISPIYYVLSFLFVHLLTHKNFSCSFFFALCSSVRRSLSRWFCSPDRWSPKIYGFDENLVAFAGTNAGRRKNRAIFTIVFL